MWCLVIVLLPVIIMLLVVVDGLVLGYWLLVVDAIWSGNTSNVSELLCIRSGLSWLWCVLALLIINIGWLIAIIIGTCFVIGDLLIFLLLLVLILQRLYFVPFLFDISLILLGLLLLLLLWSREMLMNFRYRRLAHDNLSRFCWRSVRSRLVLGRVCSLCFCICLVCVVFALALLPLSMRISFRVVQCIFGLLSRRWSRKSSSWDRCLAERRRHHRVPSLKVTWCRLLSSNLLCLCLRLRCRGLLLGLLRWCLCLFGAWLDVSSSYTCRRCC